MCVAPSNVPDVSVEPMIGPGFIHLMAAWSRREGDGIWRDNYLSICSLCINRLLTENNDIGLCRV
jgi:hypothetical protein